MRYTLEHKFYQTEDYTQFNIIKENRRVDRNKLARFQRMIESGGAEFKHFPIVVSENGDIIDGQHRFTVCKKNNLPVFFIVADEKHTIRKLAQNNNLQDKWRTEDFLRAYSNSGLTDYIELKRFVVENEVKNKMLSISAASEVLAQKNINRTVFTEGVYRIGDVKRAEKIIKWLNDYAEILPVEDVTRRDFVRCIINLEKLEGFNHVRMLTKLKACKDNYTAVSRETDNMRQLEDIYNYQMKSNKLRFF